MVDINGDINEGVDIERDYDDNMDDAVGVRLNKTNRKKINNKFVFHSMPYQYVKTKHTVR